MTNDYFQYSLGGDGIAELALDAVGGKANILGAAMMSELDALLDRIAAEGNVRALVVRSRKKDIFIAGADIHEIEAISTEGEALDKSASGQRVVSKLEALPFPTFCVIDGACVGGGLELALACDYRVVSDGKKTRLGLPEVSLGIVPGFGGSVRLPRLVGLSQALPMILGGRAIDGAKAVRIGLADALYPAALVDERASEFVRATLAVERPKRRGKRRKKAKWAERLLEGTALGRAAMYRAARRDLQRKTRGLYPAPLQALSVVRRTFGRPLDYGLRAEREAFSHIAATPASKNMVGIFLANEALKKEYPAAAGAKKRESVRAPAVIGAGKMGGSIAWLASSVDLPIRMKDVNWEAIGGGYGAIRDIYEESVRTRRLDEREAALKFHRVSGTLDYSGFSRADFVMEAIVEDPGVKAKTYAELEGVVREDAIIATNTSSLSVDELAAPLAHPERFIGFHFFNPVNRMPLVEVVPGKKTSPETLARSVEFARRLQKTPIVVHDCHGFLVNRILMAYLNEALLLLEEGVDLAFADRAMLDFGMPLGPFELIDEIGVRVAYKVAKVMAKAYPDRSDLGRLFPVIGKDDRLLGKSSGEGFYVYEGKRRRPNPTIGTILKEAGIESARGPDARTIIERSLLRMINEASLCLGEGIIDRADYLDMAMLMGTGFPAFRGGLLRYADSLGIAEILRLSRSYEDSCGPRFGPSSMLSDMAGKKARFYP